MNMKIRLLLMSAWAIILGILTCNIHLETLFSAHPLHFVFNAHPNYADFFAFDLTKIHSNWLLVKFGHFMGFAIMDILFLNVSRKPKPALLMAILFAVATEICQLYFYRDGRLYDCIIDSLGAGISYSAASLKWNTIAARKNSNTKAAVS